VLWLLNLAKWSLTEHFFITNVGLVYQFLNWSAKLVWFSMFAATKLIVNFVHSGGYHLFLVIHEDFFLKKNYSEVDVGKNS
jgi:hypothetical protein